jgi:hypothetical protein
LPGAQRAGAREQETIERRLEFRIDHLLVQQARLVDRLRHRHEDAHPVRHRHVDRCQRGGFAHGEIESFDRHRHGVELEAAGKEIAVQLLGRRVERQHLQVEGIGRQQAGRRKPRQALRQHGGGRRWIAGIGNLLGHLLDACLP